MTQEAGVVVAMKSAGLGVSQHIGDLFNLESFDFYTEQIKHHQQVFEIEPEAYIRDLHPDYLSSRFADESDAEVYKVQHHHAHAAAVIKFHGRLVAARNVAAQAHQW